MWSLDVVPKSEVSRSTNNPGTLLSTSATLWAPMSVMSLALTTTIFSATCEIGFAVRVAVWT